ncbi:MAG: LapA family protein [Candidatus Brocadiia bacterium]|nr:LapA family protein [Candidatus Brocadiia bacterium]
MTKKAWAKLAMLAVCVGLVLIVIFQNMESAGVEFLFWKLSMPQSLLLAITFLLGGLAGMFTAFYVNRRRK